MHAIKPSGATEVPLTVLKFAEQPSISCRQMMVPVTAPLVRIASAVEFYPPTYIFIYNMIYNTQTSRSDVKFYFCFAIYFIFSNVMDIYSQPICYKDLQERYSMRRWIGSRKRSI